MTDLAALQALDRAHVMPTYGDRTVAFVRGEGSKLWDTTGKEYLDFLGGLAVIALGHAHPEVARTLTEQASTLIHTSNLFLNEHAPELAATLDDLLGGGGEVFFSNSGAEANECAFKTARRFGIVHGGRTDIVAAYGSFHGRTMATLAATGQPEKHEPFQPLPPGFRHVLFDDLDALANALDDRVAAVVLEPIQGEGGVHPASAEYLQSVRTLCDERGVLLILDEIQTGLGRTGRWFGFEHAGIQPDIVTMAKALGNGVPIGACWARREVAEVMTKGLHGTTYGGQPLVAAVARTVLDVMHREDVCTRARETGKYFTDALLAVDGVIAVRGAGLLLGAELAEGIAAPEVYARCLEGGLVVNAVTPTALRFAPSLLVSNDEIDAAVAIVAAAIDDVRGVTA